MIFYRHHRLTLTAQLFLVGIECFALATSPRATYGQSASEAKGGVLSGVVSWDGPVPLRRQIELSEKDGTPSDCRSLHQSGLLDENMIVSEQGAVANVFVYIKKGLARKSYSPPTQPAALNQQGCMFRPRVQGVMVGQPFVMRNGDALLHNVRALSFRNRPFNIAQPANSEERTKVFKRKESAITIQCDLHPWMTAYVFVMDHPFFAVTDTKGAYRIDGLPDGEYKLAAWHEDLGEQEHTVTVAQSRHSQVDIVFSTQP